MIAHTEVLGEDVHLAYFGGRARDGDLAAVEHVRGLGHIERSVDELVDDQQRHAVFSSTALGDSGNGSEGDLASTCFG